MLQALYARSAESAETQLGKLLAHQRRGDHPDPFTNAMEKLVVEDVNRRLGVAPKTQRFMDNYVVGYNHKSIADCGTTTMFIENVSMLAAKAVQDWPLYCGQETSTRAIDMQTRGIIDPIGTPASKAILDAWMLFYVKALEPTTAHVRAMHPQREHESDTAYAGAVKARVFDILRGFLPAGLTTQLSWHSNLRQAGDHVNPLTHHPLSEVSGVARGLRTMLAETYEHSGFDKNLPGVSGVERSENTVAREAWERNVAQLYSYNDDPRSRRHDVAAFETSISTSSLHPYHAMLASRPRGAVLPHFLSDLGQNSFYFHLDFGSFRDIQRHRNGVCRMPMLTTDLGFEAWYLEQLPPSLVDEGVELVRSQRIAIEALHKEMYDGDHGDMHASVEMQNYVALGFKVPVKVTYGLPATVYVLELRSTKVVHPTLRKAVLRMVDDFERQFPEVALHIDRDPDDWSVRRGTQTITEKRP